MKPLRDWNAHECIAHLQQCGVEPCGTWADEIDDVEQLDELRDAVRELVENDHDASHELRRACLPDVFIKITGDGQITIHVNRPGVTVELRDYDSAQDGYGLDEIFSDLRGLGCLRGMHHHVDGNEWDGVA